MVKPPRRVNQRLAGPALPAPALHGNIPPGRGGLGIGIVETKRLALALFALAYVSFAVYAAPDFWNAQVVTRLALTIGIVEDRSLVIDRFADRTVDKAFVDGHYYTDKVPGLSFLALPATTLARAFAGPFDASNQDIYVRAAALSTSVLFGALAVALTFLVACRLGASPRQGVLAAFVLAMATPYFGWSTVFFAHATSGALLMLAAAATVFSFTSTGPWPPWRMGLGVGLLLGFTVVVDVVAAPAAAVLGAVALWCSWRAGGRYALKTCTGLAVGGIAGVMPLLIYNSFAFGSPFTMGYANVVGFEGMKSGFFGLTAFSLGKALALMVGPFRGLLPFAPVLALGPLGLWGMFRGGAPRRVSAIVIAAVFFAFVAVNASYVYWNGGWSTGPRHIVPALPFLAVAMAFAWPKSASGAQLAGILLGASAVIALACVLVTMYAPDNIPFPLVDLILPRAFEPQGLERAVPGMVAWAAFAYLWHRAGSARSAAAATP